MAVRDSLVIAARGSDKPQFEQGLTYTGILLPVQWRKKYYPTTNFRTEMDQNLVIHEYPDKDGAHVESTGRKPYIYSCQIPFYNFIKPAKDEQFTYGKLFPDAYLQFVADCEDSTEDELIHPIFGSQVVKCQKLSTPLDADTRGGVLVEVSWIEHNNIDLVAGNAIGNIQSVSGPFFSELQSVGIDVLPVPTKLTILNLLDQLTGIFDKANLLGRQFLSPINQLLGHLDRLLASIKRANSPLLSALRSATIGMKCFCIDLKQQITAQSPNPLKVYTVKKPLLISDVSRDTGVAVSILLSFNPRLPLVIPTGTAIVYPNNA